MDLFSRFFIIQNGWRETAKSRETCICKYERERVVNTTHLNRQQMWQAEGVACVAPGQKGS